MKRANLKRQAYFDDPGSFLQNVVPGMRVTCNVTHSLGQHMLFDKPALWHASCEAYIRLMNMIG